MKSRILKDTLLAWFVLAFMLIFLTLNHLLSPFLYHAPAWLVGFKLVYRGTLTSFILMQMIALHHVGVLEGHKRLLTFVLIILVICGVTTCIESAEFLFAPPWFICFLLYLLGAAFTAVFTACFILVSELSKEEPFMPALSSGKDAL